MNLNNYISFDIFTAKEWGKEHYSDWLITMQDQNTNPKTPTEQFFGIILRESIICLIGY